MNARRLVEVLVVVVAAIYAYDHWIKKP